MRGGSFTIEFVNSNDLFLSSCSLLHSIYEFDLSFQGQILQFSTLHLRSRQTGPRAETSSYAEIRAMRFDLTEIFCMDLYRILAGDIRTVRYKQNFESSKFDLSGLHCIYYISIG